MAHENSACGNLPEKTKTIKVLLFRKFIDKSKNGCYNRNKNNKET